MNARRVKIRMHKPPMKSPDRATPIIFVEGIGQ